MDIIEMPQTEPFTSIRTNVKVLANEYEIKLDRELTAAEHFHEELETIRMASENDVIMIRIDTNGGDLSLANAFLQALKETPAYTIAVAQGKVYSAGGLIMLACDEVQVSDYASMMIHTVQTGYVNSGGNMKKFSDHIASEARIVIEQCYEGFISPEEIEEVLKGDEIWLKASEMKDRLEARREYFVAKESENLTNDQFDLHLKEVYSQLQEFADMMNTPLVDVLCKLQEMQDTEGYVDSRESAEKTVNMADHTGQEILQEFSCDVFENDDNLTERYIRVACDGMITDTEGSFCSFAELEESSFGLCRGYLKDVAKLLGVKHAHNISDKKLILRLDQKVDEIVAELNQS